MHEKRCLCVLAVNVFNLSSCLTPLHAAYLITTERGVSRTAYTQCAFIHDTRMSLCCVVLEYMDYMSVCMCAFVYNLYICMHTHRVL